MKVQIKWDHLKLQLFSDRRYVGQGWFSTGLISLAEIIIQSESRVRKLFKVTQMNRLNQSNMLII